MNTRVSEINELNNIADCISYYCSDGETAESLVSYYENNEEMPEWYDRKHDRAFLVKKVGELIS